MNKIAIYCVNYNSYEYLSAFLKSVDVAAKNASGQADVFVYVADNTEKQVEEINEVLLNAALRIFPYHENLGYFGAVKKMMAETKLEDFDFVIISNVDVELKANVLNVLLECYCNDVSHMGWIAPQIYSEAERRDRNPKIVARYSLKRLRMLRLMFKYPLLKFLYNKTLYKRKKYQTYEPGEVYGGHGSFIILTKEYIRICGAINYPVFLFGEELYLAEQCRSNGLKVAYDPRIKIVDEENSSTGKMTSGFYNKCNVEALEYIIRTFY